MRAFVGTALALTCPGLCLDSTTPSMACKRRLGDLSNNLVTEAESFDECCATYGREVCKETARFLQLQPRPWSGTVLYTTCMQLQKSASSRRQDGVARLLLKRPENTHAPFALLDATARDKIHHGREIAPAYNWVSAKKDFEAQQKEFWQSAQNAARFSTEDKDTNIAVLHWAERMQKAGADLPAAMSMPISTDAGIASSTPVSPSSSSPQAPANTTYGYHYVPRNNAMPVEYYALVDDAYPHGEIEAFGA